MSGEMIQSIVATWDSPFTREIWELLQGKAGKTNTEAGLEVISVGPSLPDEVDERIAVVSAHIHRDIDGAGEPRDLHWNLTVRQRPQSEPPAQVIKNNETIGGRHGLMKLLDNVIVDVPPVASFLATLIVPNEYRCKVLPLSKLSLGGEHDIAVRLGQTTRLEQLGYRFENSPYGLDEVAIVYAHLEEHFIVTIRGKSPLRIGIRRWLPAADDMCDIVTKAFFEKGRNRDDS